MRSARNKVNVSFHGITCGRQDPIAANRLNSRQARRLDEMQPFFNAAWNTVLTVVINQPLPPRDSKHRIVASCEQARVLNRDMALVVIAIERPSLQLASSQRAFVHQHVKGMLMVIALFADGSKAID